MKKFKWLIVCLMAMALNANAQETLIKVDGVYRETFFCVHTSGLEEIFTPKEKPNIKHHKIKEVAVRKFKRNLIAPSQFILANVYGEKITIDDLGITETTKDSKKS